MTAEQFSNLALVIHKAEFLLRLFNKEAMFKDLLPYDIAETISELKKVPDIILDDLKHQNEMWLKYAA